MKQFTESEINQARSYFKEQEFAEIQVTLGEHSFSYFVLPQSLEPNLPDFVYRCTGQDPDDYVLGISDSIEERFRQYAVAHEFIEFTQIGINTKDRCVKALEKELELVPEDIKPDYIQMRLNFFRNLIQYCSAQPEFYTKTDIKEFQQSLRKLTELVS